jgi:hypothetical protein
MVVFQYTTIWLRAANSILLIFRSRRTHGSTYVRRGGWQPLANLSQAPLVDFIAHIIGTMSCFYQWEWLLNVTRITLGAKKIDCGSEERIGRTVE